MPPDETTRALLAAIDQEAAAALRSWLMVDAPPMRNDETGRAMVDVNGRPVALAVLEAVRELRRIEEETDGPAR